MRDELIEKVAREMWIASALDVMETGWPAKAWDDPDQFSDEDREPYFKLARAAISLALEEAAQIADANAHAECEVAEEIARQIRGLARECGTCKADTGGRDG